MRQAIPGFTGFVDVDGLFALARRGDAVARVVAEHPRRKRDRWELHTGPFLELSRAHLPDSHWTLLVQGVESLIPGGWELLRRFSFLPAARIDDLMISYAATHGTVGPHEDLYDVFLLQGAGRRRWQISARGDHATIEGAPIKMLKHFVAEEEFILEPGDMLYLPPGVAHWGVALEPGFTYSIGFVAPSHEKLLQNFLAYLGQRLEQVIDPDAMYEDPDLTPTTRPLAIGGEMVRAVESLLATHIHWERALVEEFLGRLLTGPKPSVVFQPPERPLPPAAFGKRLRKSGTLRLALPSRGLVREDVAFLNGQQLRVDTATLKTLEELFARRSIALPLALGADALSLVHQLYSSGYLELDQSVSR